MSKKIVITKNASETKKFAKEFAIHLKGGDVLLLYGNLGAGKTTFVQGLAEGFGIQNRIISPTFTIMRRYELRSKKYQNQFYHVDLYRLETEEAVKGSGIFELLGQKNTIIAIEWPERMSQLIPSNAIQLQFDVVNENERRITIRTENI